MRLYLLEEAAGFLRTSPDTLRYWRARGTGPKSFRLGRRVVYAEADLIAWVDEQRDPPQSA